MYRIVNRLIAIPAPLYLTPSKHPEYESARLWATCSSQLHRCLQLQLLPCTYPDLELVSSWCRYVCFHQGIQVSIVGQLGDSDFNLDISVLFLSAFFCTFLPAWETWILSVAPNTYAHLPCTTLLNSEECASSEKQKKKRTLNALAYRHSDLITGKQPLFDLPPASKHASVNRQPCVWFSLPVNVWYVHISSKPYYLVEKHTSVIMRSWNIYIHVMADVKCLLVWLYKMSKAKKIRVFWPCTN